MKRLLLISAGLLIGTCAYAQVASVRPDGPYFPNGYCQLTSLGSATALTSCSGGVPANSTIAEICTEAGSPVYYRDDGTSPTSTTGMLMPVSTCLQYAGNLLAIKFIQTGSGAVLDVSFYK